MMSLKNFANTALILAGSLWLCLCIVACGEKIIEKEYTSIAVASPQASLIGNANFFDADKALSEAFIAQLKLPQIIEAGSGNIHFTLNRSASNPRKKYCVKKVQV